MVNIKKHVYKIGYILLCIVAIVDILLYYENYNKISNSPIIPFIVLILFIVLKKEYNKVLNKKMLIFSIIISIILGGMTIVGIQLDKFSDILWTVRTIVDWLLFIVLYIPIVYFCFNKLVIAKIKNDEIKINYKTFLISFAIIYFAGFLVYLAMYPGMYGYDSVYQISMVLNNKVNTHYSVLYDYILVLFVQIADMLNRSHEFAISLYTLSQLFVMSLISSYTCYYIFKKTKLKILFIISILFYSILLPYKVMVISTSQDVLFGGCFVLLFLQCIELCTNNNFVKLKRNWIITALLVVLMCLLRNNGIYSILLLSIATLVFNHKYWKFVIFSLIVPIIVFKIISGPIYENVLNVDVNKNDSIKEMSSIFCQQLSRAYIENSNDFDKDDINQLELYYGDLEALKKSYNKFPSIADETKAKLNTKLVNENKLNYFLYWIKMGIKSPKAYIEAFAINNLGLWYPYKNYPDSRMYHPLEEYESLDKRTYNDKEYHYVIERKTLIPIFDKYIHKYLINYAWQKIPVLALVNNIGFYFVVTIFVVMIVLYNKKYKLLIPLCLVIGYYITLFLAPVALYRYVFPIIISTPLYFYVALYTNKLKVS